MTRGYKWCQESRLRRVLPARRFAHGSWPGVTGPGSSGPHSGDVKQWDFPNELVTELDKKTIIGEVLRMGVETLFSTHIYSFGGSTYRQTDGGPIGLRSTCAIARVVMARYTIKWKAKLTHHNIHLEGDALYVDDGRVIMYGLRAGWRWHDGGLWYCKQWEVEDCSKTITARTKAAIGASMLGITACLDFTVETDEEYPSNWLPTLDMDLRVRGDNIILYQFFEKPTSSKMCLQSDTALSQNGLVQSLVEDVKRRLLTTSEDVPDIVR